jgi:hypothetical protein
MSWLRRLFSLPGDDLQKGQIVRIIGQDPVRVTDPRPRGRHSTVFEAERDGEEQPAAYWRHEIEK